MTSDYTTAARRKLALILAGIAADATAARHTKAAGVDPFEALMTLGAQIQAMRERTVEAQALWAVLAADSQASWKQIGDVCRLTKQAAHWRYSGMLTDRPLPLD